MKHYLLKSRIGKFIILVILLFALYKLSRFTWIRIISLGQPKGRILFSSDRDGDLEVYSMNFNGTYIRKLTNNSRTKIKTSPDIEARFSPDGKRIVFVSGKDHQDIFIKRYDSGIMTVEHKGNPTYEIYTMDSDGSNQQRLTYNELRDSNPVFSSDDRKIAFITTSEQGNSWINIMNADGSNRRQLTLCSGIFDIEFSPDSRKIAFKNKNKLCAINTDGSGLVELTSKGFPFFACDSIWSPDNKEIAFVIQEDIHQPYKICTINADGGNFKEIYTLPEYRGSGRIEYTSDEKQIIASSGRYIYILNKITGSIRRLTSIPKDYFIGEYSLSPDGKKIIFIAHARAYKKTKPYSLLLSIFQSPIGFRVYSLLKKPLDWIFSKLEYCDIIYMIDIDTTTQKKIGTVGIDVKISNIDSYWES